MDTRHNIYVLAIDNYEPALYETAVQILQDKHAWYSYDKITLTWQCPSALTSHEEHLNFFDQVHPILEPVIQHHEVFYTTTPVEPSNFNQALKGPNYIN